MATATYLNDIISIFLQRNATELTDVDLNTSMKARGKSCSLQEIRRSVQLSGSSLFQCRYIKPNLLLIRIEPTVS